MRKALIAVVLVALTALAGMGAMFYKPGQTAPKAGGRPQMPVWPYIDNVTNEANFPLSTGPRPSAETSFTNRLGEEDLLHLANVVSRAVKEDRRERVFNLLDQGKTFPSGPSVHAHRAPIEKHPRDIPVGEKVSMVNRANEVARKLDPRVRQVKVLYRDVSQSISIANSEGLWIEGEKVGLFFRFRSLPPRKKPCRPGTNRSVEQWVLSCLNSAPRREWPRSQQEDRF